MSWNEWYESLAKPSWTPAPMTISLIWMLLYPVIIFSFGFEFLKSYQGKVPRFVTLPFVINLIANALFMPIFAGLRSVPLAAADILVVWATIILSVIAIWPYYRWVAVAQMPYFVWVSLATMGVSRYDDSVVDHGDERVRP